MSLRRSFVLTGTVLAVFACAVAATQVRAEIVEGQALGLASDSDRDPMRFRVENCHPRMRSEWRSESGELLAWDEVEIAGGQFVRYRLVRPNLGQDFRLTAQSLGVGAEGPGDAPPLLAGPMLIEFARSHLPALRRGESLRVRYLVAEREMLIALRLRAATAGPARTTVRIDAAQPWMRPLVPEALLEFDAAARFVGMQGQILPQGGTRQRPAPIAARLRVLGAHATSRCHN